MLDLELNLATLIPNPSSLRDGRMQSPGRGSTVPNTDPFPFKPIIKGGLCSIQEHITLEASEVYLYVASVLQQMKNSI